MKKILALTLSLVMTLGVLSFFNPAMVEAVTSSDIVGLSLTVTPDITITAPGNVEIPAITIAGGDQNNSATWTVVTNATGGYTLKTKFSTNTAMKNGSDQITNYTPATANIPQAWSVGASAYEFGIGTYATGQTDVNSVTWGSGSDCSGAYYVQPVTTLSSYTFASRSTETASAGIATALCFRAAQGANVYIPSGVYTGTVTAYAATQ